MHHFNYFSYFTRKPAITVSAHSRIILRMIKVAARLRDKVVTALFKAHLGVINHFDLKLNKCFLHDNFIAASTL